MSRDDALLLDMFEAARLIATFIQGMSKSEFFNDQKTQSAVSHQITIMGEAARYLSPGFRQSHAEIPWADVIGMRNILIHEYHRADLGEVWTAASKDVPEFLNQIQPLLSKLAPDTSKL